MAFFKFRKGGDKHPTPVPAAQSVEAMRTRAKHRLIGAAILVLIGVVGFPLLFDGQPRPVAVDIPIEIPDKSKVKPLSSPSMPPARASAVVDEREIPTPPDSTTVAPALVVAPEAVVSKPEPPPEKTAAKQATKPVENPAEKMVEKPVEKPSAAAADAAKALALLDGKDVAKEVSKDVDKASAMAGRFVVQVGAYVDVAKAREVRAKLEGAGLKTYTQAVTSKEGKRIRVRVGPLDSKAEAEKAAEKIKKFDLPASILEL
jgi:DedD protein